MVFARTAASRALLRAQPLRSSGLPSRTQLWQRVGRRYASSHGSAKSSSDLPWIIGSTTVTVPSVLYLLSQSPPSHHDSKEKHAHDAHNAQREEPEQKQAMEETGEDKSEEAMAKKKAEGGAESDDPDKTGEDVTAEFKAQGEESVDEGGEGEDTVKHIPDAKGGAKKRIDSGAGKDQGPGPEEKEDGRDAPASSKPPQDQGSISGKEEGISNTNTKTSVDLTENSEKSRKGEGSPESSKSKGTISPGRTQPEKDRGVDKA